jgi:hypothetical protein
VGEVERGGRGCERERGRCQRLGGSERAVGNDGVEVGTERQSCRFRFARDRRVVLKLFKCSRLQYSV